MIEISRGEEEKLCTENHSWQSPIELIFGQANYHIREMENKVVADIQEQIGVHIDKEGLLKALNGSREQYEKGYAEGREDAYQESVKQLEKIKAKLKSLEDEALFDKVSNYTFLNTVLEIIDKYMEVDE